ncbi:MAG: DinB family protein [Deltaproteobacteria bacterium]|nr:DinB family protein [Deltaproteobacteria bacterium]
MSRTIVETLIPAINNSTALLKKLIDACPENIWNEKIGGWPVWQHVTHSVSASDLFAPGPRTSFKEPLTPELVRMAVPGNQPVPKSVVLEYFQDVEKKVSDFLASVTDEDLPKANENTAKVGLNWTLGQTLMNFSSHQLYHLGYADALLRNNGLKGIY